jgi:hypothetical protein
MSWSINIIGASADVAAAVQKLDYVPVTLKAVVVDFLGTGPNQGAVQVKSSGHYDPNGPSNIYELVIQGITLAPPAEPPPPTSS